MANKYINAFYDPTTTGQETIYTAPSDARAIVQNIQVTNESGSKVVKVHITDSSASTTYEINHNSLGANETYNAALGPVILEESDVSSEIINYGGKNLGYIKVPSFYSDIECFRNQGFSCKSVSYDVRDSLLEFNRKDINGIVIANEVLDALPVERITFSKGKLLRQAVSIDKKSHKLYFDEMPITSELEKSFELAKSKLGITIPPEDAPEGWTTEWHVDNSKWLEAIYGKINNGILLIIDYAKEAKKYYNAKNSDGTIVSYENQKMMNNVLDSPGNCDLTSHVCIETLINDAETLGFNTVGITKQGEALLALGLAERLYGIQKEFKEDLSNALLRREALLRLVDPVCLGDFKWFVLKKFNEKKMNINSTCLR